MINELLIKINAPDLYECLTGSWFILTSLSDSYCFVLLSNESRFYLYKWKIILQILCDLMFYNWCIFVIIV